MFLKLLGEIPKKKRFLIGLRELFFALLLMIVFHYIGQILLTLLGVDLPTAQISGGIILFLIAIKLIFPTDTGRQWDWGEGEPFVVPIATPLIAGPTLLAAIMIYAQEQPSDLVVIAAIFAAWLTSSIIFLLAAPIQKILGNRGLLAFQRLMGLILTLISVQMFLQGVRQLISYGR